MAILADLIVFDGIQKITGGNLGEFCFDFGHWNLRLGKPGLYFIWSADGAGTEALP